MRHPSPEQAIECAHAETWRRFVDSHGLIRDYVGETPTPEDCRLGRPNALGWWSPIENGPMFTGLYLPALCERAHRQDNRESADEARRMARGLIRCASVSDVPGFIARGMGTDGQCHYPLGSDDQTHPWFYGLRAYVRSDIPSHDERREIISKMRETADALEAIHWNCPCDGAFRHTFRGEFHGPLFRDAVRYLFLLHAMHDVTGDTVWLERYHNALAECPEGSDKSRIEICAEGYPRDREAIAHIDTRQLWIYVGSQASLRELIAMETNESHREHYRSGLRVNAKNALPALESCTSFDNADTRTFGNADWRNGYPTWFPQETIEDALRLSGTGNRAKLGERKHYECERMRNPLAAAAIVAMAGDPTQRDAVERAIRHYDYSRLNMAEFFLAEYAWYALPPLP